MDGMRLAEDDNGRLFRAIADCLDAIADEVEEEEARVDNIEAELEEMNEDIDDLDETLGFLLDEEEDDDGDDFGVEDEDWEDDLNFFTCPNCGEIVPLPEDMKETDPDPICPRCNEKLFGDK